MFVWARGYRAGAIPGEDGFWPSRARCVMSDIKVDFNLIKIGVLDLVLHWGFPLTLCGAGVSLTWTICHLVVE